MGPIDELRRILVPPEHPVGTGSQEDWERVESRLGTRLPTDYKAFVGVYGAGWIDVPHDELILITPFAGPRSFRLEREIASQRDAHSVMVEIDAPYGDPTEQPDGLIPWGTNTTRGYCFWEPKDPDPDRWTVHSEVDDARMSFPENMTTYLLNALRGVHDGLVYGYERTEYQLPLTFVASAPYTEVTVPLDRLQEPGPVVMPELTRLGLAMEVVAPEQTGRSDVFLALQPPRNVALELVDDSGHWVGIAGVGFSIGPGSHGVYWPAGLESMFASAVVLEVL